MTTYDYAAAAAELGVSEAWLRDRTPSSLPHIKFGGKSGRVVFTDTHLDEIRAMFEKRPGQPPKAPAAIKPVTRRRQA